MITKKDLKLLERLYTPLAKILLEHLRVDHEYAVASEDSIRAVNRLQAEEIRILRGELDELTEEFNSLRNDYMELQGINQDLEREKYTLLTMLDRRL